MNISGKNASLLQGVLAGTRIFGGFHGVCRVLQEVPGISGGLRGVSVDPWRFQKGYRKVTGDFRGLQGTSIGTPIKAPETA